MQHIASSDAPALALDDIMHAMSPTPPPQALPPEPSSSALPEHPFSFDANNLPGAPITHYAAHTPRTSSPEPLDYSELESLRARVQECALSHNAREAELAAMVLRLASHLLLHPSPAQLASQAEAIADLTFQRNLLLRERAEEHDRWQSERELWDRTSEALVRKAHVAHEPTTRDAETQRYVARLEDDLKMTRRRLADTQSRFTALERELSRLRPLLSLHATILQDPLLWRPEHYPPSTADHAGRPAHETRQVPAEIPVLSVTGVAPQPQGDGSAQHLHPAQASRAPTSKHDKHHHRKERDKDRERPRKHRHRHSIASSRPLLADARSECILVAARKLGRLRAGLLSGFVKERVKLERDAELPGPTTHPSADTDHYARPTLLSPLTTQPRPAVLGGAAGSDPHALPEGHAGSSSPPVPLAASRQRQGSTSKPAQRRLAPSPFAPGASIARQPHMPTHLHPSAQAYPMATPGGHAMPHPGFVYFAPGAGQSGSVPFVMPVPWAVPGTPPGSSAGNPRQGQTSSKVKTPARSKAPTESSGTPMDSLVSAARTLIEDEDYDGESGEAEGSGGAAAVATDVEATAEEDAPADETPVRRRGTRRRAAAAPPDSPAPKRRRTAAATNNGSASAATAGPSTAKAPRKTKAATAAAVPASESHGKPKTRGRAKGKGKAKATSPPPDPVLPPPVAPQVARIRSALDVLADQAAQEQERWPSIDAGSRRESESEGREDAGVSVQGEETEDTQGAEAPPPPSAVVEDDVFAPGNVAVPPPEDERERTVEPPEAGVAPVVDEPPAAEDAAAVADAEERVEPLQAIEGPDDANGQTPHEDHAPAPETAKKSPLLPPPASLSTPPLLTSDAPHSESPVVPPQDTPGARSPLATSPAVAEDVPRASAEPPTSNPPESLDAQPQAAQFEGGVIPTPAPAPPAAEVEIESGDEDAEGSIVDDME